MRSLLVAGLAVLAVTSAVQANVIITVTSLGNPTDSFGDVVTGYTAYKLTASTDDGSKITSYNLGGTVGTTFTGITGPLLQEWDTASGRGGLTRTPTPSKIFAAGLGGNGGLNGQDYGIDSHFLIDPATEAVVAAPTEDNDGINPVGSPDDVSPPGEDWGLGTSLTGTFGILNASQVSTQDFAYIVIPTNSTATYNLSIADGFNGGTSFAKSGIIGVAVPEPASLGLLALGGVALLARRKRA